MSYDRINKLKYQVSSRIPIKFKALKNIKLQDYYKKDRIYVFHHIPKCAGTSLYHVLKNWFVLIQDEPFTVNPGYYEKRINLKAIRNYQMIKSHFQDRNNKIDIRYPEFFIDSRFKVFTFFRYPLQHRISLFYYSKRFNKYPGVSLEEYLLKDKNVIADYLNVDDSNYKERLDKYFFIGLVEYLQESVGILSKMMDKPLYNIPHSNKSKKDNSIKEISANLKQNFKERNELDYEIYEYAKLRYNKIKMNYNYDTIL